MAADFLTGEAGVSGRDFGRQRPQGHAVRLLFAHGREVAGQALLVARFDIRPNHNPFSHGRHAKAMHSTKVS
jgi:hypothetical protein